jgi:hypothetical protein
MRFLKVVKKKGGLQKIEVKGQVVYRSRRVLTPEEAALLGKKELTKRFEAHDDAEAERLCEGHLDEFCQIIREAFDADHNPYTRLLKADPDARHLDMEEASERARELGICDDLFVAPMPSKGPFEKLLDAEPDLRNAELHEITARLIELGPVPLPKSRCRSRCCLLPGS